MRDGKLIAGVLAVSLAYAVVRYHVFKGVPWDQLAVYTTNKAVAVAALALFGVSRLVRQPARRKHLGLVGAMFAALHAMLSFTVLEPSYFPAIHRAGGAMTWQGETSMLVAAIASMLLLWLAYASLHRPADVQVEGTSLVRGLGRIVLGLVALHVLVLGYAVWLDVDTWPGRLPPITLLSFAIALGFTVLPRVKTRPRE
jgi:hypothetical protein